MATGFRDYGNPGGGGTPGLTCGGKGRDGIGLAGSTDLWSAGDAAGAFVVGVNDFSIEAWVALKDYPAGGYGAGNPGTATSGGSIGMTSYYGNFHLRGNNIEAHYTAFGGVQLEVAVPYETAIPQGQFVYLCGTYQRGANLTFYINNIAVGTVAIDAWTLGNRQSQIRDGRDNLGNTLPGGPFLHRAYAFHGSVIGAADRMHSFTSKTLHVIPGANTRSVWRFHEGFMSGGEISEVNLTRDIRAMRGIETVAIGDTSVYGRRGVEAGTVVDVIGRSRRFIAGNPIWFFDEPFFWRAL